MIRRKNLKTLIDLKCSGVDAECARIIDRQASYVSRLLYSPEKAGAKKMGEAMARHIERSFGLEANSLDSASLFETSSHYDASHFSLLVEGVLSKKSRFSPYQSTNADALICERNQYILIIEDHSYAPRLRRGDRVLIDPERKPVQNDDLVITTSDNKVLIHCLIREDSTTFELIDSSVPGSQLIIRKSQVKKVEVIAAIIPESSMPHIDRRTMEDRLREIYPPEENTW